MMSRTYPSSLTSYDFLKAFAVLTMLIDHIGLYFFPDEMWWRAFGRLSFPIWLFLIGYARSRDISPYLIAGAVVLFFSNIVVGMGVFPLSILVSILVVRLYLDRIIKILSQSSFHLWAGSAALLFLSLLTFIVFEFGTLAFLFAIFGYLARNQRDKESRDVCFQYAIFVCLGYIFLQALGYSLFHEKFAVLVAGMVGVAVVLYKFEARTYPQLTQRLPAFASGLLKLCGRRTLEIYVAHLVLFKVIALLSGLEEFAFMRWNWVW